MPGGVWLGSTFAQVRRDHGLEMNHPTPNGLVGLDRQRGRKPNCRDKAVESILLLRTFPKAVSSPFDLIFWSDKVYVNVGRAKHLLRLEDVKFAHQIDQRLRRTLITSRPCPARPGS